MLVCLCVSWDETGQDHERPCLLTWWSFPLEEPAGKACQQHKRLSQQDGHDQFHRQVHEELDKQFANHVPEHDFHLLSFLR
jgi:hypothetical protein